jgi:voltage-gated potassium channel
MLNKKLIRHIIEDTDTRAARLFDWVMLMLIIISIVTLTIETLPGISEQMRAVLRSSEIAITILFTIEYALRVYVSERKMSYVFSFGGFIDLLAILPFYFTLIMGLGGIDFRASRSFRLLRILRLLKVGRYNKAMSRFKRAFEIAREEVVLYLMMSAILIFVTSTGIYYLENEAQPEVFKSIIHSLWWSIATLSTVGYGDVYPHTGLGKLFASMVIVIGIGIVAVPSGLMASALNKAREEESK